MKVNYFEKEFQDYYINTTHQIYSETLESFREASEVDETSDLSMSFQSFFSQAISDPSLNNFSTANWYWFSLIQDLVHLLSLHEELEVEEGLELSPSEDELFNFWHDSDYAKDFLLELNESKDLLNTSLNFLRKLEKQIISFFLIHINTLNINVDEIDYNNIPEIGDGDKRIYSLKEMSFSKVPKIEGINIKTNLHSLKFINKSKGSNQFNVHSSSDEIDQEIEEITNRISAATSMIETYSPNLHMVLKKFTHTIVPINEKGVVSYSMQTLPYFSSINMYERDFTDLLDDLLHENGHHFMNFILNCEELITEDDEKIYYSPWRRALRPVRGIYHAYFTFYWAFKLFHDLYLNIEKTNFPKELNKSKITQRLLEESLMLSVTWDEIQKARDHNKVTEKGIEIISPIFEEISDFQESRKEEAIEKLKCLSKSSFNDYQEFEKDILKTRDHFKN